MTKKLTYILLIIFAATSLNLAVDFDTKEKLNSFSIQVAYASSTNTGGSGIIPPKPDFLPGPVKADFTAEAGVSETLTKNVLPKLAVYLIGIVGGVAMLFLVISGVRFATAYGNDESVEKAKNQATWAVAGIVLALLSYTIVQIIFSIEFK
jgi:hypothetical protein